MLGEWNEITLNVFYSVTEISMMKTRSLYHEEETY